MAKKVIEQYFEVYNEVIPKYQKLGHKKIAVIYQVGSFYEFYGLEYIDGKKHGIIWEFADDLGLKIAYKKDQIYINDSSIKIYMAGIPLCSIDKYYQIAERFKWTIISYEQIKNGTKYDRIIKEITSPSININSESVSNITLCIILEATRKVALCANLGQNSKSCANNNYTLYAGISYLDSINGNNGVINVGSQNITNSSIILDEILKNIIIKNPKHINIYLQSYDIDDETLINAFHLYRTSYTIFRDSIDLKIESLAYQEIIFNTYYYKERGISSIIQQLDLEDATLLYCRISLVLLLEYIAQHDSSIISILSKPKICANSNDYLIMGNNPLEQLDVLNNMKWEYSSMQQEIGLGRRISLLEMLDKTKTPMGRIAFRNRISNPITIVETLNLQYDQIEEMICINNEYMYKNPSDKFGSPIFQIRNILSRIKNIENISRKIITRKFAITDIEIFYNSLKQSIQLIELSKTLFASQNKIYNIIPIQSQSIISAIIYEIEKTIKFDELKLLWSDVENNIFNNGINSEFDKLQEKINEDRYFMDNLIHKLSIIIERSINPNNPLLLIRDNNGKINIKFDNNQYIYQGENAQRGIYLEINRKYKDIIELYLKNPNQSIKIGTHNINSNDISFITNHNKFIINVEQLKISSSQLIINIETIRNLAKKYLNDWIFKLITIENNILGMNNICHFIEELDVLQSISLVSIDNAYIRPQIQKKEHAYIDVKGIRHPIIEQIRKDTKYIANDVSLGCTNNGILLFGVNAVGKSSLMKSIGINIIMAQAGLFVAASNFKYYPYNYLFTRIKNNDNIYAGLSSFEIEMKEFKIILQYADENSIILGDELCSGTETQDATALVTSGIIQLTKRNASYIFATHLHFLADSSYLKPLIYENGKLLLCHLSIDVDPINPSKLIYSRKLLEGSGPHSYGILVCESMNLDKDFIQLAKEIRQNMNTNTTIKLQNQTTSKYNSGKIIHLCEICGADGEDIHHINHQCTADINGIINDIIDGSFHKNSKWNLVSLCKECHVDIHSITSTIIINGYVHTSDGIILDWTKIESKKVDKNLRDDNNSNNSNNSNNNVSNDILLDNAIIQMKSCGLTPKMIQIRIKAQYGISLKIQKIREIIND